MFEEMTMRPSNWGIAGWRDVDVTVPVTFPGCSKYFCLSTPFIIDGYWSWDMLDIGSKAGVLVPIGLAVADEHSINLMVIMYETHDTCHMVYKCGGPDLFVMADAMLAVYERLTDKTTFKFVQIDVTDVSQDEGYALLRQLRLACPNTVIIVGPAYTLQHYHYFYRAGADMVVLSSPYSYVDLGMGVNERDLLTTCREKSPIIAGFDVSSPAEVIKCLALGADLVMIGPSLGNVVVEDLIVALKKACALTGFSSVKSFYPSLTG